MVDQLKIRAGILSLSLLTSLSCALLSHTAHATEIDDYGAPFSDRGIDGNMGRNIGASNGISSPAALNNPPPADGKCWIGGIESYKLNAPGDYVDIYLPGTGAVDAACVTNPATATKTKTSSPGWGQSLCATTTWTLAAPVKFMVKSGDPALVGSPFMLYSQAVNLPRWTSLNGGPVYDGFSTYAAPATTLVPAAVPLNTWIAAGNYPYIRLSADFPASLQNNAALHAKRYQSGQVIVTVDRGPEQQVPCNYPNGVPPQVYLKECEPGLLGSIMTSPACIQGGGTLTAGGPGSECVPNGGCATDAYPVEVTQNYGQMENVPFQYSDPKFTNKKDALPDQGFITGQFEAGEVKLCKDAFQSARYGFYTYINYDYNNITQFAFDNFVVNPKIATPDALIKCLTKYSPGPNVVNAFNLPAFEDHTPTTCSNLVPQVSDGFYNSYIAYWEPETESYFSYPVYDYSSVQPIWLRHCLIKQIFYPPETDGELPKSKVMKPPKPKTP